METYQSQAIIPLKWVGPLKLRGELEAEIQVPLATFETPLWPSTARGARISMLTEGGIDLTLLSNAMSRSIAVETPSAAEAKQLIQDLAMRHRETIQSLVKGTSRFAELVDCTPQLIGNILYLRLSIKTGDASGHNMVTKAADALLTWILKTYPRMRYVSISGNVCTDKKVSAVNGLLGRGKSVVAELRVPEAICTRYLRSSPQKMVDLHIKKNLLGSIVAGSLRSANAHVANMLLGIYLATGQDAANIVEGSQAIVHAEVTAGGDLYFSVTLPNLIVGTVGNGKHLPFVQDNLRRLGCLEPREPGKNAERLAYIVAATVLCGELSLLAAQTNPGELMDSHLRLERIHNRTVLTGGAG